jgi:hypothetical protein
LFEYLQVLIVAGIALGAGRASATIIVDQQPAQLGGYGSDTEFLDGFGDPVWQREADNIRVSQPTIIRNVSWWGFYGGDDQNHLPPAGSEILRVRFYGSRGNDGLPDDSNIVFEQTYLNLPRASTGKTIAVDGRPAEYFYQADLDDELSLLGNTNYWLEIVQIGDEASHFRWETGFGALTGHAFVNSFVSDWTASSGSFAFQLSTIPEPTMALLFCVALSFVLARRAPRRMPG